MGDRSDHKNVFNKFFRKESIDILKPDQSGRTETQQKKPSKTQPPQIAHEISEDPQKIIRFWKTLRQFFRSGNEQILPEYVLKDTILPSDTDPENTTFITEYPMWLPDDPVEGTNGCFPLLQLLEERSKNIFQKGEGTIIKDNLHRLFSIVASKISLADCSFTASIVMDESFEELQSQLYLKGDEKTQFEQNVSRLKEGLPKTGVLLPFGSSAPFVLLGHILKTENTQKRIQFEQEINPLILKLKEIVEVEKRKSPSSVSPKKLEEQLDFATPFVQFDKLSTLIKPDENAFTSTERLERLEHVLTTLENASSALFQNEAYLIASKKWVDEAPIYIKPAFYNVEWDLYEGTKIFEHAGKIFDEKINSQVAVFAAWNLAKLEVIHKYDPRIHEDYFAMYSWKSLTEKESVLCTPVIIMTGTKAIMGGEMFSFSKLLSSNRPINYLVTKDFIAQGSMVPDQPDFKQELGPIIFAHRNTHFFQCTNVQPLEISKGLTMGISMAHPSVGHIMNTHDDDQRLTYHKTRAAVEGRAFPGITYNPDAGSPWGKRFSIGSNPDPDLNWPVKRMEIRNNPGDVKDLDLDITFAHYLLFFPAAHKHFRIVPPQFWTDSLIPISAYLELSGEDAISNLPFLWILDQNNQLQKAVPAWPVVMMCRERLDYWRLLQEHAGVHSYHVEEAIRSLRTELENRFSEERKDLEVSYNKELSRIKSKATQDAMGQLARYLLDLGSGTISLDTPLSQTEIIEKEDPVEITSGPEPPADQKTEDHGADYGSAYIDTPLCTTCNECIDISREIFGYDENKQAYIKNKNGLFAHIVKAAEKCPVAIIHPGTPVNMQEKDISKWIKRAERFNR
jgi:ferredoxin